MKSYETDRVFYEQLERTFDTIPTMVWWSLKWFGDFKAPVGKEQLFLTETGTHTVQDDTTDNGIKLIAISAVYYMNLQAYLDRYHLTAYLAIKSVIFSPISEDPPTLWT